MPQYACKKCPYFEKRKGEIKKGMNISLILGFCKLRERFITDTSINKEHCKDRAILYPKNEEAKEENNE